MVQNCQRKVLSLTTMKTDRTLEDIRKEINGIDQKMSELYEQRMHAAEDVAAWKIAHDLPVFDEKREQEVLETGKERITDPNLKEDYGKFLQFVMDQSKDLQKSIVCKDTVAYCGIEGAFAHSISEKLFPNAKKMGCSSFQAVFEAVTNKEAEYGVVPLENTSSGLVGEVLDLLCQYPVYVDLAADMHIEQCLLGVEGSTLKDVEWVYSKDQALSQSKDFIEALDAVPVPYPNTAMAASYVASQKDKRKAAIGSRENAMLYQLKVLADNIESQASNTTRFLVISARPSDHFSDHMAMILSVSNEVGSLASVINVISSHGLNMDSIQSRPIQSRPFEYFFFIQCFGKLSRKQLDECLQELEPNCSSLKWMGSYEIRKDKGL